MTDPVMTDASDEPSTPDAERDVPERRTPLRTAGRFLLRWRTPVIVLLLLAGLAYAALVGGRMLWAEIPDAPLVSPAVTCWDGSESPSIDCPTPAGADGLHWVFPSFRPQAGGCEKAVYPGGGPRPIQFDCVERLRGSSVTLSYSQRSTLARETSFLAKRYPGIKPLVEAGGDRLVYRDAAPRADGTFEITVSFAKYPYAVTVRAESLALADDGLDQLVAFRPAAHVVVRRGD